MTKVQQDKESHAQNITYLKITNVTVFSFLNIKEKTMLVSCPLYYNFVWSCGSTTAGLSVQFET